jgi:hypothetical protein
MTPHSSGDVSPDRVRVSQSTDVEPTLPTTLFEAGKRFWRIFAPAWLFPVVFLYGGTASEELGHPLLFFFFVAIPLFFWSFFRASRPWLNQKIQFWHSAFWGLFLPLLIWTVVVLSRNAVFGL